MVIEEVPRSLVANNEGLSPDEQMLIDCLNEHDKVSKNQVWAASQLMTAEVQRLAEGDYTIPAIVKMFFDCIDRTLEVTPASSASAWASPAGQEVLKRNAEAALMQKVTENACMMATNDEEDHLTD